MYSFSRDELFDISVNRVKKFLGNFEIVQTVPIIKNNHCLECILEKMTPINLYIHFILKWRKLTLGQWECDHSSPVEKFNIVSMGI